MKLSFEKWRSFCLGVNVFFNQYTSGFVYDTSLMTSAWCQLCRHGWHRCLSWQIPVPGPRRAPEFVMTNTSDYRVDIMLTLWYEKCLRRHAVEYLIIRDMPHIHELRYLIDPCGKVSMLSSEGYHWRDHPLKHVCEQSMYISFKNSFIFSIKIVARFKIGCVHCKINQMLLIKHW